MFVHRTGALEWDTGAQVIQQSAAEAGFTVNIRGVDIGTWVDFVFGQKDFQAGFSAKVPKPVEYDLIAHMFAKTVGDASGYRDREPRVLRAAHGGALHRRPGRVPRGAPGAAAHRHGGLPDILMAGRVVPAAHAPYVKGFIHQVQGSTIFNRVWLDR
jgi:hypothetical protein